jgi:hypothetical protein
MNNKTLPIVLGVIIVALIAAFFLIPGRNTTVNPGTPYSSSTDTTPGTITPTEPPTSANPADTLYAYRTTKGKTVNAYIAPNQKIISPFIVTGNVPAGWAFEASFPVQLLDGNGNIIGQGAARVPNWMSTTTTAWYGFSVSFSQPPTANGTLLLKNDNASGDAANADEVRIPVTF